jgi:hypothetical protein
MEDIMDTMNINGKDIPLNTNAYDGLFGWCTVGGRVEEFAAILDKFGPVEAYGAVKEQYGELADEVWQGVLVFVEFGIDVYYAGQ